MFCFGLPVQQPDRPRQQPEQQPGEVGHQRNAWPTSRHRNTQRRHREQRELRPRREFDAVQERCSDHVSCQQVAEQAEDRPARTQYCRARPEQASRDHLRDPSERTHCEEKDVEPQARRPAFDQQPRQQQREAVRNQVSERAVGVDAGHDRPWVGGDRRCEHEQPEETDEAGDSLESKNDHEEQEGFQRRASCGGHTMDWSTNHKNSPVGDTEE